MQERVCDGCDHCGQTCVEGFSVTRDEWLMVRAYLAGRDASEVQRVAEQNKRIAWLGAEDLGVFVTACRYRDVERGRCSIYEVRPTVCRMMGHVEWLPCPIGAVTERLEGAIELWREYVTRDRRGWDGWENVAENRVDDEESDGIRPPDWGKEESDFASANDPGVKFGE